MRYLSLFFIVVYNSYVHAVSFTDKDVEPSAELGASVYKNRCAICHGPTGAGDGLIPLKIEGYPDANLLKSIKKSSENDIRLAIVYGGTRGELSHLMPPMGNDLTWSEIESVVKFLALLKNNHSAASELVNQVAENATPSARVGSDIFSSHCVLCHGKYGEGDGRMAKVVKAPPPANLVKSRLPDDYLNKIISDGGQAVGRSPQMPPWGQQFSEPEIESLIRYIKSIRN